LSGLKWHSVLPNSLKSISICNMWAERKMDGHTRMTIRMSSLLVYCVWNSETLDGIIGSNLLPKIIFICLYSETYKFYMYYNETSRPLQFETTYTYYKTSKTYIITFHDIFADNYQQSNTQHFIWSKHKRNLITHPWRQSNHIKYHSFFLY
jgi:hypothetical protein